MALACRRLAAPIGTGGKRHATGSERCSQFWSAWFQASRAGRGQPERRPPFGPAQASGGARPASARRELCEARGGGGTGAPLGHRPRPAARSPQLHKRAACSRARPARASLSDKTGLIRHAPGRAPPSGSLRRPRVRVCRLARLYITALRTSPRRPRGAAFSGTWAGRSVVCRPLHLARRRPARGARG
jgi:hypothetical protein